MHGSRTLGAAAIGLACVTGCGEGAITEASPAAAADRTLLAAAKSAGPSIDVSGDWLWTQELVLILPAWAAQSVFGIVPEGPNTVSRCTGAGTMILAQSGDAFSGVSLSTGGQCVTRGGQVFAGVAAGLPQPIVAGKIRGRSIQMHRIGAAGSVDCTYHAVISRLQGGTATELNGGGPCVLPGHPKSSVPLDPPPGGVQTVLTFTAVRP